MPGDVDQLLLDWKNGDQKALDNLMPLVYKELYCLADDYLNRKRRAPSMQTATLINEVYSRLIESNEVGRQNRVQFFAVAAQMMRNILVDHARNRPAARRGANKISLSEADNLSQRREVDLLELDYALNKLEIIDPQQS